MRIGIDISSLAYPDVGVSNVVRNLNESLVSLAKDDELVFFYSSLRRPLKSNFKNVKKYRLPPTLLDLIWNQWHILNIENFIGKVDVFHSSGWTQPPSHSFKVATIHDLTPIKFPEETHPRIVAVDDRRLKWVKKEVDRIICVSQSTKKDVVDLLKIDESKLRVIPNAPSPIFSKSSLEKINSIKSKYNIEGDYILAVGSVSPRKNIDRLIKSFETVSKDFNLKLVIVGKYMWGKEIQNSSNVIILNKVENEDLSVLYSGARVFVYPSLYEGFGIPILEAMACGTPVVTSNVSAMPEVAGNAAELVDPHSQESITKGIEKVLGDDKYASELISKGLIRTKDFSWEKSAKLMHEIYHELE